MKRNLLFIFCSVFFLTQNIFSQVEVKNKFFYIDGQKFFIKGIGYEVGALPGVVPYARTFNPTQLRSDMQRILSGGFNTIRTWGAFTKQELDILKDYNIKIIMGIWIDPAGDFSDSQFRVNSKSIVENVLSYSKNYSNIIGYIIMNEPQADAIFNAGYENTVSLWNELINIIHIQHPNRPVSIANTPNGTYIKSNLFDFSAYNVYIYNPVTVNFLHQYRDYINYLQQLNTSAHPLIVTEYGLSVSPSGPGNWGYGGNSEYQQAQGDLYMYKSLVDGGANGACVFNYSDGWYKSGDQFTHNDTPEEWFGLVGYSSLTDKIGQERLAWKTLRDYQSAIITQPKSGDIYVNKIPIELFLNDTIKKIEIMSENKLVYHKQVENTYVSDTLMFDFNQIKDLILTINCYDTNNILVKSEDKNILLASDSLSLPKIQISANSDCWQKGYINVNYKITKSSVFTCDSEVDYIYYPHVGFDYGQKYQSAILTNDSIKFSNRFSVNSTVNALTVGAAFNIFYNGFKKRIFNQLTLTRYDNNIANVNEALSHKICIFPNPVNDYFSVKSDDVSFVCFNFEIFNNTGTLIKKGNGIINNKINVCNLTTGMYYIRIIPSNKSEPVNFKILKL